MNLNAPIAEHGSVEEYVAVLRGERVSSLTDFAPPQARKRSLYARYVGVVAVILVHGMLALLYTLAGHGFTRTEIQSVAVIDIPPELPKPVEPPPPPKFQPPEVYVPAPIIPLLVLDNPPPTPNAITIPPAQEKPAPPTVPLMAAPTPFEGDARAAYVGALLKHLNRFKRYPESAKLRHEQGVVSLRFTIDGTGHVLASSITKSSGSKALDGEVLQAVQRADPLPRIPTIFGRNQLDLIVPVEFVLR